MKRKDADRWNEEMAILGNALTEKQARLDELETAIKAALVTAQSGYEESVMPDVIADLTAALTPPAD